MTLVLNLVPSDALVYPWWGDPYEILSHNIIKKDLPTLVAALLDL